MNYIMKKTFFLVGIFVASNSYAQKALTNEISGELRGGIGIAVSKLYADNGPYNSISFPMATLYYAGKLSDRLEIQGGIAADARGGKTDSPISKYRSYNASGLLGLRYIMKDLKVGAGMGYVYFLDTRKTVLEGSLAGGVVHIPVRHFRRTDVPLYLSAEAKIHEKFALELRFSRSIDAFSNDNNSPTYAVFSLSGNYLLTWRYKRVNINSTK